MSSHERLLTGGDIPPHLVHILPFTSTSTHQHPLMPLHLCNAVSFLFCIIHQALALKFHLHTSYPPIPPKIYLLTKNLLMPNSLAIHLSTPSLSLNSSTCFFAVHCLLVQHNLPPLPSVFISIHSTLKLVFHPPVVSIHSYISLPVFPLTLPGV